MMYADDLKRTLDELAERAARAEGVELAWVELLRQRSSWVLRVFIERPDGNVDLADCERVTRRLGVLLDVEDPIESSYTLEVSSPGLDRPLHGESDFRRFSGKLAKLQTKEAVNGRKRFQGRLAGVADGSVVLEPEDGEPVRVPLALIDSARLEVDLDLGTSRKPGRA